MAHGDFDFTLDNLQGAIGRWADRVFPDSTLESMRAHLQDEVEREIKGAIESGDRAKIAEECADAFMVLLHICHRSGVSLSDATAKKWDINKGRKFNTKDPKGFIRHDEEA